MVAWLQKLANPSAEAMTASEVLFVRYFEAVEPKNAEAAAKAAKDGLDRLLMHLFRQASQQPTTGRAPSDAAAGTTATGTPVPDTTPPGDPSPTHAQP